jgi:hypothetical protein
MRMTKRYAIVGGSVLAIAAGGGVAAIAVDGGTANAVERDSENGATWEVEVTKPDGQTVDVRLNQNYELVVIEGDTESPDDADGDE